MSNKRVNSKISSNPASQSVPGTPLQQMWHVLNFHEQRLIQISQAMQEVDKSVEEKINNAYNSNMKLSFKQLDESVNAKIAVHMAVLNKRIDTLASENAGLKNNVDQMRSTLTVGEE